MDTNYFSIAKQHNDNTPDLTPYKRVIHGLAPLANKSIFNSEFEQQTKSVAPDLRFLVKMEIKRLAKPCIRSIDLRSVVQDDCRLFDYQGIQHYLNINGILSFEKLVKRYGEYTFGVYEGVLEEAHSEREQHHYQQQNKQHRPSNKELELQEEKYTVPCQGLLKYPTRKQERLNYVVTIEVFFADNTSAHARTLDLSVDGLRIRLNDHHQLSKVNELEQVTVVFRGLKKHEGLSRESIKYQILSVSGEGEAANIHMYRGDHPNPGFEVFARELVELNKHRYKVNLENVEMALASKIYEQSFAGNTPSLPVFICQNDGGNYCASYASVNASNKSIIDYWTDENGKLVLGFMLNHERIAHMKSEQAKQPSIVIYCFNHVKDGKVYFYSATEQELDAHSELSTTFLSYGSRKASWRVFQVSFNEVNWQQAYSPSALPDGISKQVDELNKPLSPRLQSNLQRIQSLATVTDITNEFSLECYQKRPLYKAKIKLLKQFGHAKNKPPVEIETRRHKQQELRRQTRYIMRTQVVIHTLQKEKINGITEDISTGGIKVELDAPLPQRVLSKIYVSFVRLHDKSDNVDLSLLPYRVVHLSSDKQVLHLQAISEEDINEAEMFFAQLIEDNIDKLPPLEQEESIDGLGTALRNLHSKYSPQFCAYVEKKQKGYLPAMATENAREHSWTNFLKRDQSSSNIDLSCLYQDIEYGKDVVNQSLKVLKVDPKPIKTELFIAAPDASNKLGIVRAKWQYEFADHSEKLAFINQARENGKFVGLSVTINKALKPDMEKLEQELMYLGKHGVHKATYFEERMWDIAGAIFLNEISEEVLFRYGLNHSENV